jgi:hypothetical protein
VKEGVRLFFWFLVSMIPGMKRSFSVSNIEYFWGSFGGEGGLIWVYLVVHGRLVGCTVWGYALSAG